MTSHPGEKWHFPVGVDINIRGESYRLKERKEFMRQKQQIVNTLFEQGCICFCYIMRLKGKIAPEEKYRQWKITWKCERAVHRYRKIWHTIERLSGVAAKVSDEGGCGSASEAVWTKSGNYRKKNDYRRCWLHRAAIGRRKQKISNWEWFLKKLRELERGGEQMHTA